MKYIGSKARIAYDILPIMLDGMKAGDTFVDAFCGGCNLLDKVPHIFHRIANDKSRFLIAMWKVLTDGDMYKALTNGDLFRFPMRIDKGLFDECRDCALGRRDKYDDAFVGWVGFMAGRNGRFFDGGYASHDYNGRDYIMEQIRNTLRQVQKLQGVEFYNGDYFDIPLKERSTIYCDIPYFGVKQYLTSRDFDYEKFYAWCREMKSQGHRIFVSEYQMPDDFECIWEKEINCSVHKTKTYKRVERLFTI